MKVYEVVVQGDEPWPDGIRDAYSAAVEAAEEEAGFLGYGLNVHEDAEGPCWSSLHEAEALADAIRRTIWPDYRVSVIEHTVE